MKWIAATLLWLVGLCTRAAVGSEGYNFAFALSPSQYVQYNGEMIVNARQTTDITITTSTGSEVLTVYGDYSLHYDLDYSMRTEDGIESKGILVSSQHPVTIHTATYGSYGVSSPDACLVRPIGSNSVEHFLAGYGDMENTRRPMSFYMVVASEGSTQVDVYYPDGVGLADEHFTLNQNEVFTRDVALLTGTPEIDFTGTRVLTNKPVGVYAGNGAAYLAGLGGDTLDKYMFESMPSVGELGTNYTSFPVHYGGVGGYEVRVISVEDNTEVHLLDTDVFTLNMGEFHLMANSLTRFSLTVYCSKPCMVVQYMKSLRAGGDTGLRMATFLAVLIPDERAVNNLIFTVPRMASAGEDYEAALSIIMNVSPVTGLHLNDTSLADLGWTTIEDSDNVFATVDVESGFYQLYSTEPSEMFTAYLYVIRGGSFGYPAVGFPVGYEAVESTPPPPTVPPPQAPRYQVTLLGDFISLGGEDFTMECSEALGANFRQKTVLMVPGLNEMMGDSMCTYLSVGDVQIKSQSALLLTSGPTGSTVLEYFLEALSHVSISNLSSCAEELSVYLQDFSNWQQPIIPPEPGCPTPVFDPEYFVDGSTGNDWICIAANKDEFVQPWLQAVDAPHYSLSIFDNFTTVDDEELSADCADAYRVDWRNQVDSMVVTLNNDLASGQLCSSQPGTMSVVVASSLLVSQVSQGSLIGDFLMALATDHLLFDDVHSCVNEMFLFLEDHNNWGTLPLLPPQFGCPALVFTPPVFYHNGENWQCL